MWVSLLAATESPRKSRALSHPVIQDSAAWSRYSCSKFEKDECRAGIMPNPTCCDDFGEFGVHAIAYEALGHAECGSSPFERSARELGAKRLSPPVNSAR
jgi:hypothetical protein